jgi:hypothetical protein
LEKSHEHLTPSTAACRSWRYFCASKNCDSKVGPVEANGRNVQLLFVKKGFGFFGEMHLNDLVTCIVENTPKTLLS